MTTRSTGAAWKRACAAALATMLAIAPATIIPAPAHAATPITAQMDGGATSVDITSLGIPASVSAANAMRQVRDEGHRNPCLGYGGILRTSVVAGNTVYSTYNPNYDCDAAQVPSRTARYWDRVSTIASQASGNDYDRALHVYDALLSACSYNHAAAGRANADDPAYYRYSTPASALLDGSSVCAGYAYACVDLFRAIGLTANVIGGSNHAYVSVVIDGITCTCDPTNDDSFASHDYFMLKSDGTEYRPNAQTPSSPAPVTQTAYSTPNPQNNRSSFTEPNETGSNSESSKGAAGTTATVEQNEGTKGASNEGSTVAAAEPITASDRADDNPTLDVDEPAASDAEATEEKLAHDTEAPFEQAPAEQEESASNASVMPFVYLVASILGGVMFIVGLALAARNRAHSAKDDAAL